ncbi:hypothetical protein [Dethiothermospora halolimnae]|uniref:hypothetical protein n=1 Tax=Dethiothermospora halolimnae TaxID=3114390 RepID=UPI003CCB7685
MKKIRTKKMMILLIIITILLGTAYMLYDNIVYAVGIVYEKVKGTDKADDYYNKIANELSDRDGGLRAANRRIENILKKDTSTNLLIDKVNISYMGLTTCNFKLDIEKLKGINEEYNKIKNVYKKDDLLARYEIGVSLMNWLGGKSDKAIYILENIDYIEEELNDIRKLNLAIMYINSNRIKEGQQIIKKDINKNDKYKYIREGIIQYVKFIEGNFDDFSYSKEYNYNYKPKIEDPYVVHLDNMDSVLRNIKNFLDMRDKHENYKNEVTGNISYKGKGMSNIIVYLKEEEYKSSCSFGEYNLVNDYIKALAVTDSDGNYTIKNIPDGNYIIGVLLDWHKVKDKKIEFKGEPIMIINNNKKLKCDIEMIDGIKIANVEKLDKNKFEINWKDDRGDISYYSLNLEKEGVNYYVADNIKTKSTIIDLNKQLKDGDILISGMTSNSLGVNPYFILPPLYFSGDYKVQVNGYNREGDIITDSRGTFNNEEVYINIEGKELTKADKYLVERDYEKAIELYDKSLKEDPKDIHSAKILAKLYKKGWKYDREDGHGNRMKIYSNQNFHPKIFKSD